MRDNYMKILKKILCLLIICLFTTSFVGCSKDSEIIDENYIKTNTTPKLEKVFKAINDEDYINFISELDYKMKRNTTAENFKSIVKNIKDTIGEYQSSEYDSYEELDNDYITVKYKAVFSGEPDETVSISSSIGTTIELCFSLFSFSDPINTFVISVSVIFPTF